MKYQSIMAWRLARPEWVPGWAASMLGSGLMLCGFGLLGVVADPWLGEGYSSLIFVLAITVIGAVNGLVDALVCALLAALAFNYFISAPLYDIALDRSIDFATPVVFTLVAVVSGMLSGRLREQTRMAQRINRDLETLLEASRHLQAAGSPGDVHDVVTGVLGQSLGLAAGLFWRQDGQVVGVPRGGHGQDWTRQAAALLDRAQVQAPPTAAPMHDGALGWLLGGGAAPPTVLLLADGGPTAHEHGFFDTLASMVGQALERVHLMKGLSEAQAQARTEELKSALLASVSHDLRSPLTVISTSAASLLAFGSHYDHETSQAMLRGIEDEAQRLAHLTTNLLQMTRLQSQELNLRRTLISAPEMIARVVASQQRQHPGRAILFNAPDTAYLVVADATLFELALTNLVQNALQYSAAPSAVWLDCQAQGSHCTIAVRDEGLGIPVDQQGRVFERFARMPRDEGRVRGSGLGLAIAKGFVEASGGTISLASPLRAGKGTCLTIRLPLAREQD